MKKIVEENVAVIFPLSSFYFVNSIVQWQWKWIKTCFWEAVNSIKLKLIATFGNETGKGKIFFRDISGFLEGSNKIFK